MFSKVLVANRGEIAIRAFRAAYELGIATVAVFPHEDRNSLHRAKADESYQIGAVGHPVRAYLSVDEVIKAARRAGADASTPATASCRRTRISPQACAEAGITFVGPPADVLHLTGNKARAVAAAREAGRAGAELQSRPSTDVDALVAAADDIGFPIFVKAVAGGGGRGMRRVERAEDLREPIDAAMREAESAFGDATVFLEQAVVNPRHIEVQILADAEGNVVAPLRAGLLDAAPPPEGDRDRARAEPRPASCGTGSAPTPSRSPEHIGYVNAGTVEFLLDERGNHVFIEMNPRIQVEHTVTEQVTDRDLVIAQLRIAAGATLPELHLSQDQVTLSGAALQCRVTTEDPANGFRPDTGVISNYRSPGGPGVRLDGGTTHTGAEVSAHFDSMLVKLTCYGHGFAQAVRRARRAIAEFRIRGVATNLPFLAAVLDDPDFQAGRITTSFIDERPGLLRARKPADRGTRLLTYLAETTVNRPHGRRPAGRRARRQAARARQRPAPRADGSRQLLRELGPEGFARRLREQRPGRRHGHDVPRRAPVPARHPGAHPRPAGRRPARRPYGAAAALAGVLGRRDLRRRAAVPRRGPVGPARRPVARPCPTSALQMLLRGRNTVGYTPYPTEVTDAFVARGRRHRAWTSSGSSTRSTTSRRCARRSTPCGPPARRSRRSRSATPATCPTRRRPLHARLLPAPGRADRATRARTCSRSRTWPGCSGRPPPARWSTALRERFDLPVHLHTHDTAGGQLATLIAAIEAGVDAVDGAVASMAGTTSQPSLSALVAATDHTERATGLSLQAVGDLEPYWEAVRKVYRAVRVRARVAHRPGLPPRDPRRAAVQPAPAGHRAGAGGPVRADRGPATPPPTGCSDGW